MLKGAIAGILAWGEPPRSPVGIKLDNDEKTRVWVVDVLVVAVYGVVHQM
jgi:hypothetical protein